MTHIKGSFVLTRSPTNNANIHISDIPKQFLLATSFKQKRQNFSIDKIHDKRSTVSYNSYGLDGSDDENGFEQLRTDKSSLFPDALYNSDLDDDDDSEVIKTNKAASAEALYLSSCEKYGAKPSSIFINIIKNGETCVSIRHASMSPMDIKAMISSLEVCSSITKLNLSGNELGSIGTIHLAKSIKHNKCITELNLSHNNIGQSGCEALCQSLLFNCMVSILILDGNRFDDKCAIYLAELLASHKYLIHVSLSENLFESTSAAQLFAEALSNNESVEHLDVSFNHFQQKATAVFITFLSKNFRLRSLNLSYSSFGLAASKAFSLAMQTKISQLEELDLSSNIIDDSCAPYLANVLSTNESLRVLNLMQNPLSVDGCYTLLKPLQTMPTSQLESIDIRDMSIKSEAFIVLANDLEDRLPKLIIRRGEK
ncbi:unnamed protein product [Adineta ricciae]|uniref:Uncharacterized protein n=1 Tax=Adineta ricciae TaxID=249248 RepID=A0A814QGN4_ADIRI|nr:unnamed protein product [Adineta ricciae]CAF1165945.1 unnamed protein product [Adineta ricciae]